VHVSPKRFPAAYDVDWRGCVLVNGAEFIVAHKPARVSVVPTVDNVRESCLAMLERELGIERDTLKPIHRLDVGTEGVLVLGKTSARLRKSLATCLPSANVRKCIEC
jgi:23S rRNA-/tRNA-specific pseudouridylate synthase